MAEDKPITSQDLYAPSSSASPEDRPLKYEETPLIEPISGPQDLPPRQTPPPTGEPAPRSGSSMGIVIPIVLFILLFLVGFGISGVVRNFLGSQKLGSLKLTGAKPTPTAKVSPMPTSASVSASDSGSISGLQKDWKTYSILNGTTRQPIAGLTVQIPSTVLTPVCDSSTCPSQGTYLPGGTRFTLAPRGKGQVLPNYQNRIISDTAGKPFTLGEKSLTAKKAIEFTGSFTGNTISGYSFSRMRGYMIELTPDMSLEINHFVPNGVNADFAADDALFEQIVATVAFQAAGEKGAVIPTPAK